MSGGAGDTLGFDTGFALLNQRSKFSLQMDRYVILAIIAFGFAMALSFHVGADVALVTGEWVNFALWKLEANGLICPIFASSRPFDREEIARIIADTRERIEDGRLNPNPLELALISKLEAEFARDLKPEGLELRGLIAGEAGYHDEWDSPSVSLWSAASFHPIPGVMLYEEIDIGKSRGIVGTAGKTASKRTNSWKWGYTADFRKAYMSFRHKGFKALLGRQSLFWGPGYNGSLIISDNSPAFDMMLLQARFGSIKAIAFSAVLDKVWSEHGNPPYRYLANRYLSGHRIDWIVNDRIELALSELVLYGGETRSLELYYVNPLLPYYASQWNSEQDDNVLVSADFAIRPVDRLKLYGQLLVDDFSYSGDDPNMLGYMAGLYLSDPLRILDTDVRVEYTRIDSYTYTHRIIENQFTHYGWMIGHHLGANSDQLLVELSRIESADMRLNLTYAFRQQGNGAVTKHNRIGLRFLWEPSSKQQIDISWTGVFTRREQKTERDIELKASVGFLTGVRWLEDRHGNDQKGVH